MRQPPASIPVASRPATKPDACQPCGSATRATAGEIPQQHADARPALAGAPLPRFACARIQWKCAFAALADRFGSGGCSREVRLGCREAPRALATADPIPLRYEAPIPVVVR